MESVRAGTAQILETSSAACQVCGASGDDVRCATCGAVRRAGQYEVVRLISQTPHSRVYLARGPDGARIALKELSFAQVPDRSQVDAFEREARLLALIDHPRIPRCVSFFREGDGVHTRLYLAQQFVEGQSLEATGRLSERDALLLARDVLEILRSLHGREPPVVHRDIKPSNLIRDGSGALWLVDFGAARDLARGITHGATLVGTFGYMPPEQLGGTVQPSVDLYALGTTLIHLLSGVAPSEMLTPELQLDFRQHLSVNRRTEKLLARLTARNRSARFPSATEALRAVERLLEPRRSWSIAPSRAAVGIAAAIGLSVLGVWVMRSWPVWFGAVEVTDPVVTAPTSDKLVDPITKQPGK